MDALLLTLHLLGVGVLIGVVVITFFIGLKGEFSRELTVNFIKLRKIGSGGAALAILSGLLMAVPYYEGLLRSPLFLTKLALVFSDGVISQLIILPKLKEVLKTHRYAEAPKAIAFWSLVSLIIVVTIVAISVFRSKALH